MPADSPSPEHLLQLLPEAVVQTDSLWIITFLNPAWHTLTGHSVDAALGQLLLDFVHPDDTWTLRSGMPVFRLRYARADYLWMPLQMQPEYDAENRVISRQGVLIEITEVTEHVLTEVRQRFLRLLETIDGVAWEAELNVGNTFLSPQVERLFGYTVEEWRSHPSFWRAHVNPDDLPAALAIDDAAYKRPDRDVARAQSLRRTRAASARGSVALVPAGRAPRADTAHVRRSTPRGPIRKASCRRHVPLP